MHAPGFTALALVVAAFAGLVSGCASPGPGSNASASTASSATAAARLPIYMYAYQEGQDPKSHIKHSIFIIGDANSGSVRYTAASFENGARASLASSGNGSFEVKGGSITIKAGALNATGEYKPGKSIVFGQQRFDYATKL